MNAPTHKWIHLQHSKHSKEKNKLIHISVQETILMCTHLHLNREIYSMELF